MKLNNKNKILLATLAVITSSACGSFDGRSDSGGLASASTAAAPVAARADAGDPQVQLGAP
ncbi:MAG: hypothetical protein RLZZ58_1179, partial [Pseudomonadota bacterium]